MASSDLGSPPADPTAEERRRRRQGAVLVGLLLTFLGAFLVTLEFPVGPNALIRVVPVIGAGLFALWLGGLLMGRFSGQRVGTRGTR